LVVRKNRSEIVQRVNDYRIAHSAVIGDRFEAGAPQKEAIISKGTKAPY
jgi:hypothetical protein